MDFYSNYTAHETLSSIIQGTQVFTELSELVCQLGKIGVDGPRHFSEKNMDTGGRLIGRGAQFEVFEFTSNIGPDYVVKRVRLDVLPGATPIDSRSHLRTLQLEIASLCDPGRRSNRNIVALLAWGYDYPSPELSLRVPVLCVEKAMCALDDFLRRGDLNTNNYSVPYQLCLDVSAGLCGIHSTGLVHGDLKPANILVFKQNNEHVPFIAKLSDFGQCIEVNPQVKDFTPYSGTLGWRPPECAAGFPAPIDFNSGLLFKCDSYAFGLLAMSILVFSGEVVQDQELIGTDLFLSRFQSRLTKLPSFSTLCIERVKRLYLQYHPTDRSMVSPDMLKCEDACFTNWQEARSAIHQDSSNPSDRDAVTDYQYYSSLDRSLLAQLEAQLSKQTKTLQDFNNELVFGMAIGTLARGGPGYRERAASYFEAAARQSNLAARAIFRRLQAAAESNGVSIGLDDDVNEWLFEGAITGSLIAMEDLRLEHPDRAKMARQKFVQLGGFNRDISTTVRDRVSNLEQDKFIASNLNQVIDDHGNRPLHYAASCGLESSIEFFVRNGAFIDEQNHLGETALYKACQAGSFSSVKTLTDLGASASLVSKPFGVSCLHWLFNFEIRDINEAARLLVSRGAQVDAVTKCPKVDRRKRRIPAAHYPFYWPQGSPIHWAAFTRSSAAIDVLLDLGAHVDSLSTAEPDDAQTALAMVAHRGDSKMIKHLILRGANANLRDNLKCTPLDIMVNRYVSKDELHNWPDALRWWIHHGSWDNHVEELIRCVQALADAGCDLNAWRPLPGSSVFSTNPIVDAVDERFAGAALALLRTGADVDCVRPYRKDTPLHIWAATTSDSIPYADGFSAVWTALLKKVSNLSIRDFKGKSVWHQAIRCGLVDDFRYVAGLLTRQEPCLSLELADDEGRTPLIDAMMFKGHITERPEAMIWTELLLDLGADVTAKDNDNRDFLLLLCMNFTLSDSNCLGLIQKALREMSIRTQQDLLRKSKSFKAECTPLMWACHNTFTQVVKLFLALGVDINVISKTQGTALDFALDSSEKMRRRYLTRWISDGKLFFNGHTLAVSGVDTHVDTLKTREAFLADTQAVAKLFHHTITEADVRNKLVEDGYVDACKYFDCMELVKMLQSAGARSVTALTPNFTDYEPWQPREFDERFIEEFELRNEADDVGAEMQPFYEEHWKLLYTLRS